MLAHGIVKNPAKDLDDALDATCVGVDLCGGTSWAPPPARLWGLLDAISDLARLRVGSPGGVAAYMGVAQWYDLLRRLRLSVFNLVYDFSSGSKAKDWSRTSVPDGVIGEMLLDMVLAPFGTVHMRLPYLEVVAATDASRQYGHGGVIARLPRSEVRKIAKLASKRGGHVQLHEGQELAEALEMRLGPRHDLGIRLRDFDVIFSVRVVSPGHINLEEGRALITFVKWVLRCERRFRKRVVVLVDSKVVLGACVKGRSSSAPLNALLRRLAALCFAGGLVLHCVFVPTSHNPSDWPSRGGPETWPAELRYRRRDRAPPTRCPGCGLLPREHPACAPKRLRGTGLACSDQTRAYSYDHERQVWVSAADRLIEKLVLDPSTPGSARRLFDGLTPDVGPTETSL